MILGLCRFLLRDATEAEDATQQVFLSAQRAVLAGVMPRDPAAWLATIARNECRARIRVRMREPLALPDVPADLADPLATAIRTADLELLWSALAELPRRQRNAFLLRELGGLSYAELGAALGVTRPAVESLLFRARRQLRDAITILGTAVAPFVRFVSGFGGGTPAKVAAVAVGAGIGAVGVVELPAHHAGRAHRAPPQIQVVAQSHKAVAVAPAAVPVTRRPTALRAVEHSMGREVEHEPEAAEPVEVEQRDTQVDESREDSSGADGGGDEGDSSVSGGGGD
jgi:RNA polymerase sigma factor (sigma-70 family)